MAYERSGYRLIKETYEASPRLSHFAERSYNILEAD
jgi:hypothetical protein